MLRHDFKAMATTSDKYQSLKWQMQAQIVDGALPSTVLRDDGRLRGVPGLHVLQEAHHWQEVLLSNLAFTQQDYIQQEPSCEWQNQSNNPLQRSASIPKN